MLYEVITGEFEMNKVANPPGDLLESPFEHIAKSCPEKLVDYLELFSPVDSKGRYLHFDELRYRLPKGIDPVLAWSVVKLARFKQINRITSYNVCYTKLLRYSKCLDSPILLLIHSRAALVAFLSVSEIVV